MWLVHHFPKLSLYEFIYQFIYNRGISDVMSRAGYEVRQGRLTIFVVIFNIILKACTLFTQSLTSPHAAQQLAISHNNKQ